ncbi:MAG: RsmB/NOP family class I SAM-dependent RNA methyltransferase, partial [Rhizobiales bacterium]|nr:RsmB/NOP family class I SAM-dependent RNA methyltransferase [Hyphomicrobiales bacterium]
MKLGGRIQAAIEVLDDVEKRHRPVSESLKDWGLSHRFAGSGDRAAIGNIAYDSLRWKASSRWRMDSADVRHWVLGTVAYRWHENWGTLESIFKDDKFAPQLPDKADLDAADERNLSEAPEWVQADLPKWLVPHFESNFDDEWVKEAQALAERPPLDMRVNTIKSTRAAELKALDYLGAIPCPISRNGIRIPPSAAARRHPNVQNEESYRRGRIEIQDESSQIASQLIYARSNETVLDFCAGAGGKTLALAADMNNEGKLYAYDSDRNRLGPIYERLDRAGIENTTVLKPEDGRLAELLGNCDRVLVDAPCTGTGTWRRRPDAKWRLNFKQLSKRKQEQQIVLEEAAPFVKAGGFLV